MGKKLFVGGLPYATSSSELEELFGQVGKVESADVITDRNTGRSRGFGFVEMEKDEDAAKAIEKLNGSEVGGRNIVVAEAKPREEQPGGEPEEPKEEQPEREEPEKTEEPEKAEEPKE
jgi:RNA recognition motif-containing protein